MTFHLSLYGRLPYVHGNHTGVIMVNVFGSSAIDHEFEPGLIKPKTIKMVFTANLTSPWHQGILKVNIGEL